MYRKATQEEIRNIKAKDWFLVRDAYDTDKVWEFQAYRNASCTNGRWYVTMETCGLDGRTGNLILVGYTSFGDDRIVIEE